MTFKFLTLVSLVVENFDMFIEFRTVKNLVGQCEIFTSFCYKFIQVKSWRTRPQLG